MTNIQELREEIEREQERNIGYTHGVRHYFDLTLAKVLEARLETLNKCEEAFKCSKCDDTLENTQLICWTCHCEEKDKVRKDCEDAFKEMIEGDLIFLENMSFLIKDNNLPLPELRLDDLIKRKRELLSQFNSQQKDNTFLVTTKLTSINEGVSADTSQLNSKEKKQDE